MRFSIKLHRNIRMTYGLSMSMFMKVSRYDTSIAIVSKPNA